MDKPIPEGVVTDKLIADLLPPALIFADTDEHLAHARQRAKTILLETLTAAQQQGQAQGGGDVCRHEWITTGGGNGGPRRSLRCSKCHVHRDHTAPPSAPVGVEGKARELLAAAFREAGCPRNADAVSEGKLAASMVNMNIALAAIESALAQQPAAVDGTWAKADDRAYWMSNLFHEIRRLGGEHEEELLAAFRMAETAVITRESALAAQHQEPTT